MRKIYSCMILLCLTLFIGACGGSNSITPDNPVQLIGDWNGTYENSVVGVGIIQATFYMDGTTLRVSYDLQSGEVTGDSSVSVNQREISFIGVGTKLQQMKGEVADTDRRITGTIIIDYTIWGTTTGTFELNKV